MSFSVAFHLLLMLPFCFCGDRVAVGGGNPTFDATLVDEAVSLHLMRFGTTTNYNYGKIGPLVHYLSLVALYDDAAVDSEGNSVADRVAEHLRNVVAAGNEPALRGIMLSWGDHHLAGIVAISSRVPRIWDALSDDVKDKLDLLMRVGLFTGAIQHNAVNECYRDMTLTTAGNYNPNQRSPMVALMSYAFDYFGGATEVNAVLAAFDFDSLVAELTDAGYTRILDVYNAANVRAALESGGSFAGGACVISEQGVRAPFTFNGRKVSGNLSCPSWTARDPVLEYHPMLLYQREEYEFNMASNIEDIACKAEVKCGETGHVQSGSTPGAGSNTQGSFLEYNINGRSSPDYVKWGATVSLHHYLTLVALGYFDPDDSHHRAMITRTEKAVEGWRYRMQVGWYDTAFCEYRSGVSTFAGNEHLLDAWDAIDATAPLLKQASTSPPSTSTANPSTAGSSSVATTPTTTAPTNAGSSSAVPADGSICESPCERDDNTDCCVNGCLVTGCEDEDGMINSTLILGIALALVSALLLVTCALYASSRRTPQTNSTQMTKHDRTSRRTSRKINSEW